MDKTEGKGTVKTYVHIEAIGGAVHYVRHDAIVQVVVHINGGTMLGSVYVGGGENVAIAEGQLRRLLRDIPGARSLSTGQSERAAAKAKATEPEILDSFTANAAVVDGSARCPYGHDRLSVLGHGAVWCTDCDHSYGGDQLSVSEEDQDDGA